MRRVSLVVVLLLASLGTASAECAWVLWVASEAVCTSRGCSEDWHLIKAYTSERACEREAVTRRKAAAESVFTCVPETIDPRGPKGR
jgi:hypothetical protein